MNDVQMQKAKEALQRKQLQDIIRKYSDVRYRALCRRKSAMYCTKQTGLPYRIAYDISGAVAPPDACYPKSAEAERDDDIKEMMFRMMACRRDRFGNVLQDDQTTWNKLYDRIQERYKAIRGWNEMYDRDWFRCFRHFLEGYNIATFSEFDLFGTVGEHSDNEVQEIIRKLAGSGT